MSSFPMQLEHFTDPTNDRDIGTRSERLDARRGLQLALAGLWLLDGILQLQSFMFTSGPKGFSGMLAGTAAGNPGWVASTITWNSNVIDHHAVATNSTFAVIQILIGIGIAWRRTLKVAMGASLVWSLGVWWFGEGLGGVLHGAGSPLSGGPGAVLFYALLAILLWPSDRSHAAPPFAAAGGVGVRWAKAIWSALWVGLGILALLGSGRSPNGIHDAIMAIDTGEPSWLSALDRHAQSLVSGRGLGVALVFTAICAVLAIGVYLPKSLARASLMVAVVTGAAIWVFGENFGMILAGNATDPNSGPLLILLALAYWPLATTDFTTEFRQTASGTFRAGPRS